MACSEAANLQRCPHRGVRANRLRDFDGSTLRAESIFNRTALSAVSTPLLDGIAAALCLTSSYVLGDGFDKRKTCRATIVMMFRYDRMHVLHGRKL